MLESRFWGVRSTVIYKMKSHLEELRASSLYDVYVLPRLPHLVLRITLNINCSKQPIQVSFDGFNNVKARSDVNHHPAVSEM